MSWLCKGCGAEVTRSTTTIDRHGNQREACSNCSSTAASGKLREERPVLHAEAHPEMYDKTTGPDGETVYIAKDELRADTEAELMREDDTEREAAMGHKRRNRRTKPLSQAEIESLVAIAGPAVNKRRALLQGIALPDTGEDGLV